MGDRGHNTHGLKRGGLDVPLSRGKSWVPSNTMWPGTRPTRMPSFILIRPTVWPQYINVTDRQDRTDRTDRTTVRYHRANRFTSGRPKILFCVARPIYKLVDAGVNNDVYS